MRFIKLTSLNTIPCSIKIHSELCEIIGAIVLVFLHTCDLESRPGTFSQNVEFNSIYHHTVSTKSLHNSQNSCQCLTFWTLSVKLQLQTCQPQNTSASTPNSLCPYFQILTGFSCGCTTNQPNKKMSKNTFSQIVSLNVINLNQKLDQDVQTECFNISNFILMS